ncbi:MAG: family 31 glucosidase [Clostridia bacterium]|nr:family 31 glucosidase [Clostridia bacterium]
MITKTETSLTLTFGYETLRIEAWGRGLRVCAVPFGQIPEEPWALDPAEPQNVIVDTDSNPVYIENSGIRCTVRGNRLVFTQGDKLLLEEQANIGHLGKAPRQYRSILGSDAFEATVRFRAFDGEKIHGMGQYRDARYDLKGCTLELAHRNSQISIPFFLSSRGYGFLWNNPAFGTATFAANLTEWKAASTKKIDYWVCAADTPAQIMEKYTEVTGRPTELPESLMGLWQCKLRYRTQEELLEVAREYHRRGIKLDVIVIDFFHWNYQGDWDFDPEYWPDPQAMVDELKSYGTRLMVSVWPTVDERCKNFREYNRNGYLVASDRGFSFTFSFMGCEHFLDATNPGAQKMAAGILKKNYGKYGIDMFWLDVAEPEYSIYDRDIYRYHLGPSVQVGNIYPRMLSQAVYEGLKEDGTKDILNLVRCAWVGSPKYGALVWSGDIDCSFDQMKRQIANGINMGTAGIPYWISDTGGFEGGNINDPKFRELIARWYQWAVFTPVLRMHGDRQPHPAPLVEGTDHGGGFCFSGAPNELWSYGDENYAIFVKYLGIREGLKEYIKKTAKESEATGIPMIRGMFLEFPDDKQAWEVEDQYMFGSEYLVAPVTEYGARERSVYLPAGRWEAMDGSGILESKGDTVTAAAPIDYMPVYKRL